MGTASATATRLLNRIPMFMNNPRRVSIVSFDIGRLPVRLSIESRIWLPGVFDAQRGEPGDQIGDLLVRQRLARNVVSPVGCTQLRTTRDDDRAQALIAD